MSRRSLIVALAVASLALPAESVAHAAASRSADTATAKFTVANLDVIHRRLTTSEIVVAQLYLLGGSRQLTFDNAGIEAVMLGASEYGTRRYPGRRASIALTRTGSTISFGVTLDWSVLELRTIRTELDSAWRVYADRIANPELSSAAFEIARDRLYAGAQFRMSDPDALVAHLADSVAFQGHPYSIDPAGNERSLRSMKASDVVAYQKAQTVTSRMLLVIVGNVSAAEVRRLVTATLGKLLKGNYRWALPPELPHRPTSVVAIPRPLRTNYLLGYFPGPPVGSKEHPAFRVATALLSGKLAFQIREQRKLSYAAYAPFLDRAVAAGGVYVSTTNPEAVLPLVKQVTNDVITDAVTAQRLPSFVSQFTIEFLLVQETYDGQASELARAHLLRGDFRQTNSWLEDLRQVTPTAIQDVARRYFTGVQYVAVGDTAAINRAFRR